MAPDPFWKKARVEFTGGEGIQGEEAGGKLDLGQAALAMQPPEKICGREIVFLEVTLLSTGTRRRSGKKAN